MAKEFKLLLDGIFDTWYTAPSMCVYFYLE